MNSLKFRILLLCGSIIFTFLFLEVLLRIIPIDNKLYYQNVTWDHWKGEGMPEMYNSNYVYDELLGYEKKSVYKEINGMSDDNKRYYKILILGDSVTEQGFYVEPLQDLITKRYNTSSVVIVNAGVTGYDTELEYNYLKYRSLELKPDLVIIQFNMNDFESTPVIIKQKDGSWLALSGDKKLSPWISPILFVNSKLYQVIMVRLLTFSGYKGKKAFRNNVALPLGSMKQLLEEKGIPFYFVIFPLFEDSERSKRLHDDVINITNELGLGSNTIDLVGYYSGLDYRTISNNLYHPNKEGGKIAADALAEKLIPFLDERLNKTKNL